MVYAFVDAQNLGVAMNYLHDLWHSIVIWMEGHFHQRKCYFPELISWALFALCLAALCFVLGISAGFMLG